MTETSHVHSLEAQAEAVEAVIKRFGDMADRLSFTVSSDFALYRSKDHTIILEARLVQVNEIIFLMKKAQDAIKDGDATLATFAGQISSWCQVFEEVQEEIQNVVMHGVVKESTESRKSHQEASSAQDK